MKTAIILMGKIQQLSWSTLLYHTIISKVYAVTKELLCCTAVLLYSKQQLHRDGIYQFFADSTTVANMNSPDEKPVNPLLCEVQQCFFCECGNPPVSIDIILLFCSSFVPGRCLSRWYW